MIPPKRFFLRTYGCQMNTHDSEKVANLLYHAGYVAAESESDAQVLIINTCSIREKAENQLYSDLGKLREWKGADAGRALGVAGCVAQQVGDAIQRRFPHVDFVFGTHNLRHVPAMLEGVWRGERSLVVSESASLDRFDLPGPHPDNGGGSAGRAYLTVMEGCDMFCSFCIVPQTRGREISRKATGIIAEAEALARQGVRELTLLGQTVNAYGRHDFRRGRAEKTGTMGFGALLRRLGEIPGIARLRYTSPHPIFFDNDLVQAHGDLPALCPHVHLPVQSGSDPVLARMRRRYTAADYRGLIAALRAVRPDIAFTSDLIVGFPGETDEDFQATLNLVREVRFVDCFSFKYSPRPGTGALTLPDGVAPDVAQARLEELQALQRSLTLAAHRERVGERTEVLVAGPSRRGSGQLSGRDPYHRVVNFAAGRVQAAPGTLLSVKIVEATPHSLIGECPGDVAPDTMQRPVERSSGPVDDGERSAVLGA